MCGDGGHGVAAAARGGGGIVTVVLMVGGRLHAHTAYKHIWRHVPWWRAAGGILDNKWTVDGGYRSLSPPYSILSTYLSGSL